MARLAVAGKLVLMIGLSALAVSCSKPPPSLATKLDDLLRNGQSVEARQKRVAELPALVRKGEFSEANKVADVLETHLPSLPKDEADDLRRTSLSEYVSGISSEVEGVPFDDICEAAVNRSQPPAAATLAEFIEANERRESLTEYCALLGLI